MIKHKIIIGWSNENGALTKYYFAISRDFIAVKTRD